MQHVRLILTMVIVLCTAVAMAAFREEPKADSVVLTSFTPTDSFPTTSPSPSPTPSPAPEAESILSNQNYNGQALQLGRVLEDNTSYTRHYITYKSDDLTISGIMNVPKGGTKPYPVIITNHGYIDPAVYTNGRGLKREQDYLAKAGYVVLHPDYRNHADSSKDPDNEPSLRIGYVADVINAVLAVKNSQYAFLDKNRIGMLGHSMGGGVSQYVMVIKPDLVKAVVLFAPVSADARDNFERWSKNDPHIASVVLKRFGDPITNATTWAAASPITYLDRVEVPVVIHHGDKDDSVPLAWSQTLADKLKAEGKNVTLYTYPGEPHEFATAWPQVMERTKQFFDQHI